MHALPCLAAMLLTAAPAASVRSVDDTLAALRETGLDGCDLPVLDARQARAPHKTLPLARCAAQRGP